MRLLFIFYAIGPVFFGFSLAYLLVHPDDWTGPAVVLLLSLILTVWTQWKGTEWLIKKTRIDRYIIKVAQWVCLAMGVILFFLMYFWVLRIDL